MISLSPIRTILSDEGRSFRADMAPSKVDFGAKSPPETSNQILMNYDLIEHILMIPEFELLFFVSNKQTI